MPQHIIDRYKGKYTTLYRFQPAYPTASAGDYAQVDAGAGSDVINYNYDVEDGWVEGSSGSGATTTDELTEGSTNLYFTQCQGAEQPFPALSNRINSYRRCG